jgi:hypothetical protein
MNIVHIHGVSFDDKATLAMGVAFDQACRALRQLANADARTLIAHRIIEAAIGGELDPVRLSARALTGFNIDEVLSRDVGVDLTASPAHPTVAHAA